MSTSIRPGQAISPEDRRALISGALVLTVLLSYAWIARPWSARLEASRAELVQQRGLLARERSLLETGSQLPRLQRQANATLATARTRLLPGDSVTATAALASRVDDIAMATGVRVLSIEGRAPASSPGLTTVSVELRGEARWSQVLSFVRTLESTGSLIDVAAVRLERGPAGGVAVSATLTGMVAR